MKAGRETDLVRACLDFLHLRGVYAWRNNTTGVYDPSTGRFRTFKGLKGVSDILGVLPDGTFLACECKTPRGKVSDEQQDFIDTVRRMDGVGLIVRSLRDLEDALVELGYA